MEVRFRASAGAVLDEAAAARPLLAILEGVVRVYTCTADGRQVTLRYARPGGLVGLPAALSPRAHTSTEAVTNATVALLSLNRLQELSRASRQPRLAHREADSPVG